MIRRVAGLALAAVLATCTGSTPPHSSAQRIGKLEQTIGGPHAIGQVGDWLLENDQVRFIVAEKGGVVRLTELQQEGYAYLRP